MNKRGLIIIGTGLVVTVISLLIAISIMPPDIAGPDDVSVSLLFDDMFDEIFDDIVIVPGDSTFVSYSVFSNNVSLMWGVQITNFESGDKLLVRISNIFGDDYGEFIQDESISFQMLSLPQSDTLTFEIENIGTRNANVVVMFSEDPENSEIFSKPDSASMNLLLPLAISGFLLILGITISLIGVVVLLLDLKNNQNNKRSY